MFTGGSLLFGSTGRTDLVDEAETEALTRAQYNSVRRLAEELPDGAAVYPTHGFGSFCSASSVDEDASTIGLQRQSNPALTKDEQAFVDELLTELSAYPAYYAHMGVINSEGPAAVDLSLPKPIDADELRRRLESGEWVVDLRHRVAFAAGHLNGSLGFELSGSFVTYLGWLHPWGTGLTLIGEDEDQIVDARRELARIGVDDIAGSADIEVVGNAADMRTYRVADFVALAKAVGSGEMTVLDVRQRRRVRRLARAGRGEHSAARADRPRERVARRRGLGALRIWLSRVHRGFDPRQARARRRADRRRIRQSR